MKNTTKIEFNVKDNVTPLIKKLTEETQNRLEFRKLFSKLFHSRNASKKLFCIKQKFLATNTGEIFINLEPTDAFKSLIAAFRANDLNSFFIQHKNLLNKLNKKVKGS